MKRVWKKIGIAALGMVLCFGATIAAMVPTSRSAEATVMVFDPKNVEEAVKTAKQTMDILTETQKQYLMFVLNMKKFEPEKILRFVGQHDENVKKLVEMYDKYNRIVKDSESMAAAVQSDISRIERIGDGDYDMLLDILLGKQTSIQQRIGVVGDAAKMANDIANNGNSLLEQAKEIQEASANAESEVQQIQAGNEQQRLTTTAVVGQTNQLNAVVQMMVNKESRELTEQAAAVAKAKNTASSFAQDVSGINPDLFKPKKI